MSIPVSKMLNVKINSVVTEKINYKYLEKHYNTYKANTKEKLFEFKELCNVIPHESITFRIDNTKSQFANMIRRALDSEIEVYSFSVELEQFKTENRYIIFNLIKDRIEAIPLNQLFFEENMNDLNIYIKFKNNSKYNTRLLSKDIIVENKKKKKKISTIPLFDQNIVIFGNTTFILSPETKNLLGAKYILFEYCYSGMKYDDVESKEDTKLSEFLQNKKLKSPDEILNKLNITNPLEKRCHRLVEFLPAFQDSALCILQIALLVADGEDIPKRFVPKAHVLYWLAA